MSIIIIISKPASISTFFIHIRLRLKSAKKHYTTCVDSLYTSAQSRHSFGHQKKGFHRIGYG